MKYVDLRSMHHLMDGLSFRVRRCAEVLDHALVNVNEKNRVPDRIVAWNARGGPLNGEPLSLPGTKRLIVQIEETFDPRKKETLTLASVGETEDKTTAPAAFFNMHSLSLDVPMRVEVPLRTLLKGGQDLKGKYVVYLHALLTDDDREYVYYGITKRGWNRRFLEHTKTALGSETRRLFPNTLQELIRTHMDRRAGRRSDGVGLSGLVTAVCAAGVDEDAAMDVEEYLVDKYSLASKHPLGLNMIPGGKEGIRRLHELTGPQLGTSKDTEEREDALDRYLAQHPALGVPKPAIAEKWNDPTYAEAVICGRENRLTADQVREIRYLAALGNTKEAIRAGVGAIDLGQVERVLAGRTYGRIR